MYPAENQILSFNPLREYWILLYRLLHLTVLHPAKNPSYRLDSSRGVPSCKNIHSIVYTISGNAPSYRSLDPAECSRLKFAPSHKLHHVVCSITGDAPSPASGWKVLKLRIRFAPCHPGQLTFSGVHVATADQLISLVPTWQQPTADQLISPVPTWPHRII